MSFFEGSGDPVGLPKTRQELRMRKMRRVRIFMVLVIALVLVGLGTYVVVAATNLEHKVTKTSPNTWHVEDPNNHPEKWLGETCASEGKTIANLSARANDYDSLDVVCR